MGVARTSPRVAELERGIAEEQRIGAELFNQNQDLIAANLQMRERLIGLAENLTQVASDAQACLDRLPNTTRIAPRNRIGFQDLNVGATAVVIRAADVTPGLIGPTGSMRPLLDEGVVVLELPVAEPTDLFPGDIVIYELNTTRVIHRIVGLGYDSDGWYAIAKGDNNPLPDPGKVRFAQVRGVVGGIIY